MKNQKSEETKMKDKVVEVKMDNTNFTPAFCNAINFRTADEGIVMTMIYAEDANGQVLGRFMITNKHAKEVIKILQKQVNKLSRSKGK